MKATLHVELEGAGGEQAVLVVPADQIRYEEDTGKPFMDAFTENDVAAQAHLAFLSMRRTGRFDGSLSDFKAGLLELAPLRLEQRSTVYYDADRDEEKAIEEAAVEAAAEAGGDAGADEDPTGSGTSHGDSPM